ncbi:zinc finger protein 414-like [Thrips palmi]|uniref:Zinc finger protein 414-like n=1 Tax=Thrips palmi TaxID=161013 RepID=A0A6P8Z896_THRPL|nr:zinc finger protein 414-like [Thrips palmi]
MHRRFNVNGVGKGARRLSAEKGSTACASRRLAVKPDFGMRHFGARGPLLKSLPTPQDPPPSVTPPRENPSVSAPCDQEAAGQDAAAHLQPSLGSRDSSEESEAAEDEAAGPANRVGWCITPGCDLEFASWADHVEHQREVHCLAFRSYLCSLCLDCVSMYPHMRRHELVAEDFQCASCSAQFVDFKSLHRHGLLFHRLEPQDD